MKVNLIDCQSTQLNRFSQSLPLMSSRSSTKDERSRKKVFVKLLSRRSRTYFYASLLEVSCKLRSVLAIIRFENLYISVCTQGITPTQHMSPETLLNIAIKPIKRMSSSLFSSTEINTISHDFCFFLYFSTYLQ